MSRQFILANSLLWLSAAAWSAPASRAGASPPAQLLPMLYYGTRPAVEVRVDGQGPFLFLIDTGAGGAPARADAGLVRPLRLRPSRAAETSHSGGGGAPARADAGLVRRLGLRPSGATETSDAGGAAASIDRVTLDRVELGTFRADRVEAYARDYNGSNYLPRIDGILGFAFFANL